MLSAIIVEDNAKDRRLLEGIINRYEDETGNKMSVLCFDCAETFLAEYKGNCDVVFMDVVLPYADGIEAAKQLRKIDEEVALIFVTDMKQFAIQGYRYNALDYFVKPANYFDVKFRLDKIAFNKRSRLPSLVLHIPGTGDKVVNSDEVYYVEIADKELTYHTVHGDYSMRSKGLKSLEAELAPHGFARCSSSFLVNLKWCRELNGDDVVVNNTTLKISRSLKQDFVTKLSRIFITNPTHGGGGAE